MDSQEAIIPGCNNDFNSILSALTDPPAKKNIDPNIIKTLYQQGYSYTQIAKALKISKNTVYYHMCNIRDSKEIDRFFEENRSHVFRDVQRRLLTSIDDDEIKKTPVGSRVLAVAQLYDKERLETNQSTENTALIMRADPGISKALKSVKGKYGRGSLGVSLGVSDKPEEDK